MKKGDAKAEVIVVGGGIVGLATAWQLLCRHPRRSVLVLEKEPAVAQHQTGRNSGVIHSGIYYRPGSLKALNCRAGKTALQNFCLEEGLPFEICGKVIVATRESERERLRALQQRGLANGVACTLIDRARLRDLEPFAAGIEALHVPETGIVDYRAVCHKLVERIGKQGGRVVTGARMTAMHEEDSKRLLVTTAGEFHGRWIVNCAGLHADRVADLSGVRSEARIVPFRGEYFSVKGLARRCCRNLIYPVPDPQFPFLGVHFTRMVAGGVECGPNAVLAFAREGYRKTDFCWADLTETWRHAGFRRLALQHWRMGLGEIWRSISREAFVRALQRLVPDIRGRDLEPAPAGIRAQAIFPDGRLADDFLVEERPGIVNVINAPSPAATASLAIGQAIVEKLERQF
jgi:L-2-hydroxyglutarate oxidase